jgi:glucose/arabinose dehydrogenase
MRHQWVVPFSVLGLSLLLGCSSGRATTEPTSSLTVSPPTVTSAARATAESVGPASARPAAQLGPGVPAVKLDLITNRLDQPVAVTHAGDGSGRLFVLEKKGRIVIVRAGTPDPITFIDLRPLIRIEYLEQGLLSLAFHPNYANNGLFYVHYTPRPAQVVVARYRVSAENPDIADANSAVTLLHVNQPNNRHHGGGVVFGPDGYLYVGLGDGSSCADCQGSAQNTSVFLGKILRLDVDNGSPYAIPPDNPLVNRPGARPEIWAYGLRNPWRFSFDRATGDLYIADAGQHTWEEINFQPAGSGAGRNYGWNRVEGRHCYPPRTICDASPFVQPVAEYEHSLGCAIVGGHVYRGPSFPQFDGLYFFGDFCTGRLWALQRQESGNWRQEELLKTPLRISSFGEDEVGEIYLTSLSDGSLYRLVPAP